MSKTRAQIQFKVLSILVGGDVGQSPSAEDAATINGYINSAVKMLGKKKIAYISDADDLDDDLFEPFCQYTANLAANEFGSKYDPAVAKNYENEIRVLEAETPGYGPQETSYF